MLHSTSWMAGLQRRIPIQYLQTHWTNTEGRNQSEKDQQPRNHYLQESERKLFQRIPEWKQQKVWSASHNKFCDTRTTWHNSEPKRNQKCNVYNKCYSRSWSRMYLMWRLSTAHTRQLKFDDTKSFYEGDLVHRWEGLTVYRCTNSANVNLPVRMDGTCFCQNQTLGWKIKTKSK